MTALLERRAPAFDGPFSGAGTSLDEAVVSAWSALETGGSCICLVCGETMEARPLAGQPDAVCSGCASRLS